MPRKKPDLFVDIRKDETEQTEMNFGALGGMKQKLLSTGKMLIISSPAPSNRFIDDAFAKHQKQDFQKKEWLTEYKADFWQEEDRCACGGIAEFGYHWITGDDEDKRACSKQVCAACNSHDKRKG